jgi:hypothetical protein
MIVYILFFAMICSVLAWVTVSGKDVYPFSSYPMFSAGSKPPVKVIRLALEDEHGNITWWHSRFYRYPEFAGKKLASFYQENSSEKAHPAITLAKAKLLKELTRLINKEEECSDYKAFHIIERTITEGLQVTERTLEIIKIDAIENGRTI